MVHGCFKQCQAMGKADWDGLKRVAICSKSNLPYVSHIVWQISAISFGNEAHVACAASFTFFMVSVSLISTLISPTTNLQIAHSPESPTLWRGCYCEQKTGRGGCRCVIIDSKFADSKQLPTALTVLPQATQEWLGVNNRAHHYKPHVS